MKSRHPELVNQLENMKATLADPDFVYHSLEEENHQYHKKFRKTPVTGFVLKVAFAPTV